jgi:hypothetical protein
MNARSRVLLKSDQPRELTMCKEVGFEDEKVQNVRSGNLRGTQVCPFFTAQRS